MNWKEKAVLVTGGTGSFGQTFVKAILQRTQAHKVVVFSRDELKQWEMRQAFGEEPRLRFFIGDVRDVDRLRRAFRGIDHVVHAAALKQIPATEYNPFEAVMTNILGAKNVIDAAIDCGVQRVVALSTDKASAPINLYGATKLVSDKLFIDGNAYAGDRPTRFAVVRYGNVVGSRGSVVPLFRKFAKSGVLPVTDERMTRFWITLQQCVQMVFDAFDCMSGGELFIPKIPSMRVVDLARAIAPDAKLQFIGIRPGEKLHEELIGHHDAARTIDVGSYYVIGPEHCTWPRREMAGTPVPIEFHYTSDANRDWLSIEQLRDLLRNA